VSSSEGPAGSSRHDPITRKPFGGCADDACSLRERSFDVLQLQFRFHKSGANAPLALTGGIGQTLPYRIWYCGGARGFEKRVRAELNHKGDGPLRRLSSFSVWDNADYAVALVHRLESSSVVAAPYSAAVSAGLVPPCGDNPGSALPAHFYVNGSGGRQPAVGFIPPATTASAA
jgi:hypothetical protein